MRKVKKYNTGVQKLSPDMVGMASGVAAAGIDKLGQRNSEYRSELKDGEANTGRMIGSTIGSTLNLVAPGLGSAVAPLLGAAGAAVQRTLQKGKLEKIKDKVEMRKKVGAFNESIDNTEATTMQANQYKKGTRRIKYNDGVDFLKGKEPIVKQEGNRKLVYTPENITGNAGNYPLHNKDTKPVSTRGKALQEKLSEARDKGIEEIDFDIKGDGKIRKYKAGSYKEAFQEEVKKVPPVVIEEPATPVPAKRKIKVHYGGGVEGKSVDNLEGGLGLGKGQMKAGVGTGGYKASSAQSMELDEDDPRLLDAAYRATTPADAKYIQGLRTKRVEVEGGEVVGKVVNGTPQVKGTVSGPSHAKGGVKMDAEVGDFIVPKDKAEQFKSGTKEIKKRIIKSLPEDKPKAEDGTLITGGFKKRSTFAPVDTSVAVKGNFPIVASVNNPLVQRGSSPIGLKAPAVSLPTTSPSADPTTKLPSLEGAGDGLMKGANIINNLAQSMKKPDRAVRRTIKSDMLQYEDGSKPQLNAINQANSLETANAVSMSGGNAGNVRANRNAAYARKINRTNEVINNETQRKIAINNQNVAIKNADKQTNLNLANGYDEIDAQNKAVKDNYRNAATKEMAMLGQANEQKRYQMKRDVKMDKRDESVLPLLSSSDYEPTKDANGNFSVSYRKKRTIKTE